MIYADSHCDTITKIYKLHGPCSMLYSNSLDLDIRRAAALGEGYLQTFAMFVDTTSNESDTVSPYLRFCTYSDFYHAAIVKCGDRIMHCQSAQDIDNALSLGKIAAVLSIENGAVFEGDISKLHQAYSKGVRLVTLTWNDPNQIGTGAGYADFGIVDTGLTEFGKACVYECEHIGMGIDVSHLSPRTFDDVLNLATKPVFATHSCCSALAPHRRNLSDAQLASLAANGAYVGICFYGEFLCSDPKAASADTVVDHIEHAVEMCGEDNVGFGSDFDGFNDKYEGFDGVGEAEKLCEIMLRRNFSGATVRKIAGLNYITHLKRLLN